MPATAEITVRLKSRQWSVLAGVLARGEMVTDRNKSLPAQQQHRELCRKMRLAVLELIASGRDDLVRQWDKQALLLNTLANLVRDDPTENAIIAELIPQIGSDPEARRGDPAGSYESDTEADD